MITALPFRHVIVADFEFEFGGNPGRVRFAWWRRIYAQARLGGYSAANLMAPRPSQSGAMRCSLRIMPAPSLVISRRSAGQCRPTYSIYLLSFGIERTD
jgi:hypothetical protein